MQLEWTKPGQSSRTYEELKYAIQYCKQHNIIIDFDLAGVTVRIQGRRSKFRAYDIVDAVKSLQETYLKGQP